MGQVDGGVVQGLELVQKPLSPTGNQPWAWQLSPAGPFSDLGLFHADAAKLRAVVLPCPAPQVRSQALLFIKRMYEKEQLREYVEKFALNYLQLLVHPNPPSVLFGADKDTGLAQVLQRCSELGDSPLGETARQQELERAQVVKAGACRNPERVPGPA